jgi:hypothetical protein
MAVTTILKSSSPQTTTLLQTGMCYDVNSTQFPLQQGVPVKNIYAFEVTPAPGTGVPAETCISAAQAITAAGFIPLNTTSTISGTVVTANVLSTVDTYSGVSTVFLDCERCPALYFNAPTTNVANQYCVIGGYDYRGIAVTQQITIPNGVNGELIFDNPMAAITSVYFTGLISDGIITVSVGNSNRIGLPYFLSGNGRSISLSTTEAYTGEGNIFSSATLSTAGNVVHGNIWRVNPPSASNPCRGFLDFTQGQMDVAFDGDTYLTYTYYVNGGDSELNNLCQNVDFTAANANNTVDLSAMALLNATKTASGNLYGFPYLTPADLVGLQFSATSASIPAAPALVADQTQPNNKFYTQYNQYMLNN